MANCFTSHLLGRAGDGERDVGEFARRAERQLAVGVKVAVEPTTFSSPCVASGWPTHSLGSCDVFPAEPEFA